MRKKLYKNFNNCDLDDNLSPPFATRGFLSYNKKIAHQKQRKYLRICQPIKLFFKK